MPDFVILLVSQKIQAEREEVQRFKRSDISQGKSIKRWMSAKGQIMSPHNREKEEKYSLSPLSEKVQVKED